MEDENDSSPEAMKLDTCVDGGGEQIPHRIQLSPLLNWGWFLTLNTQDFMTNLPLIICVL